MNKYKGTLETLKEGAIRHWPQALREKIREASILELLLSTQDYFISVLKVASASPEAWLSVLNFSDALPKKLFLKHLMVLSDIGGEALNKLPPLCQYIPEGKLRIPWPHDKLHIYELKIISGSCSLTNSSLHVDGKSLEAGADFFTPKMMDTVMLILYGGMASGANLPNEIRDKCVIGEMIGKNVELDTFVRQNYIRVSRQVAGANANALGNVVQQFVIDVLKSRLPENWTVKSNAVLSGVSHTTDNQETTFDIVVNSSHGKSCGIEVSFQVTTNSVIERKAREAENLYRTCHKAGHKLAYVIDGAGNIDIRKHAVGTICSNSDCTVAFSEKELVKLTNFLLEALS